MNNKYDVTIVSAFGRGHWLAAELADNHFSVLLLDISESLGRWAPEDWEGPFGLLQNKSLTSSQNERLVEEDYHDNIPEGVVLW